MSKCNSIIKLFDVIGIDGERKLRIVAVDILQAITIVTRFNFHDYKIQEAKWNTIA